VTRFYSIDQANARLRDLGPILHKLKADRDAVADAQRELVRFRATNGNRHHAEELKAPWSCAWNGTWHRSSPGT